MIQLGWRHTTQVYNFVTFYFHFSDISGQRHRESQIIQGKMLQQLEIWIKYEHFFFKSSQNDNLKLKNSSFFSQKFESLSLNFEIPDLRVLLIDCKKCWWNWSSVLKKLILSGGKIWLLYFPVWLPSLHCSVSGAPSVLEQALKVSQNTANPEPFYLFSMGWHALAYVTHLVFHCEQEKKIIDGNNMFILWLWVCSLQQV